MLVADGEQRVVDGDGVGADQHHVAERAQPVGVEPGGRAELTQRLVPSAAALRPSRVVANFQVTNGRPCSTAKVQTLFRSPRLDRQKSRLDLDAGGAQRVGSPGRGRVGVGLGEHHPAYAGRDQRLRARAGAAGVVAGLEGDDGGGAARPGRRPGRARRPRRAAVPAPRW